MFKVKVLILVKFFLLQLKYDYIQQIVSIYVLLEAQKVHLQAKEIFIITLILILVQGFLIKYPVFCLIWVSF